MLSSGTGETKGLADTTKEKGGAMKIITVIIFVALLLAQSAFAQDKTVGAWHVRHSKDPFTDAPIAVAAAIKQNGTTIGVRCKDASLDVMYDAATYLNDHAAIRYRYRIDTRPVIHEAGTPSTDGTVVYLRNPGKVANALARGDKFVIEAEDYRGVRYRASFSLDGSAAAIRDVLSVCHIDPDAGQKRQAPEKSREFVSVLQQQYVMAIRNKIQNSWIRPAESSVNPDCLVAVTQSKGGDILSVTLQNSCGSPNLDQSVLNAVRRASPLPSPPSASVFAPEIMLHFTLGR